MEKYVDLSNQRFGKLLAIKKVPPHVTKGGRYVTMWECKCDCGNVVSVSSQKLRNGHTTSCGCNKKNNKGGRFDDLTGKRFGKITVIRYLREEERERKRKCWLCRCDCGTIKQFSADKLKSGSTTSCGCAKTEKIRKANRKYEHTNKRLYSVYSAMKDRCYNQNSEEYHNYGARGITICPEWLKASTNLQNGLIPMVMMKMQKEGSVLLTEKTMIKAIHLIIADGLLTKNSKITEDTIDMPLITERNIPYRN